MKKSMFITGVMYILIGSIFWLCGLVLDTKLNSLFWGFAGAGIVPGLVMIYKYFYWSHPKNSAKYTEKIERQKIDFRDERKEKFRNQSGRYAYILGLITVCISSVIFSILHLLGIIQNAKILILYLGGYMIFQYISGVFIFRYLDKKY